MVRGCTVSREYPIAGGDDHRFEKLARDVGKVLEQHHYPSVRGADRLELENLLWRFIHEDRAALPAVEVRHVRRSRGTEAPPATRTFTSEGELDSDDCSAAAHELRRLKGASGAIVVAMDERELLHIGMSVQGGSTMDYVANRLYAVLDNMASRQIKDVVIDIDDAEAAS